jgi:hypothetical protein
MEKADTLAVKSAWCRAHHAASKTDAPNRQHDAAPDTVPTLFPREPDGRSKHRE